MLKVSSLVVHIWLIPFLELQVAGQKTFKKKKQAACTQLARPANVHGARRTSFSRPLLKSVTGLDQNFRDSQIWVWDFMRLIFFNCSILEFWPMFTPMWYPSVEMLPAACVEKKLCRFLWENIRTSPNRMALSLSLSPSGDSLGLVTIGYPTLRLDKVRSCSIMLHPWYITVIYGDIRWYNLSNQLIYANINIWIMDMDGHP